MIAQHSYIKAMNETDEPLLEINEIIYRISGAFWKQAYNSLLTKQKMYKPDLDISSRKAITELRKELKVIAEEYKLKCTSFSHNEHFYISLVPVPIYVGIERDTGNFTISAPHVSAMHYPYSEYIAGVNWIRDYLNIDMQPLNLKTRGIREKFYLNSKSSGIVSTSIKALCEAQLGKTELPYKINQSRLRSDIIFQLADKTVYEINIYHKPFSENASILIDLLSNPREVEIEDVVECTRIFCTDEELKSEMVTFNFSV